MNAKDVNLTDTSWLFFLEEHQSKAILDLTSSNVCGPMLETSLAETLIMYPSLIILQEKPTSITMPNDVIFKNFQRVQRSCGESKR